MPPGDPIQALTAAVLDLVDARGARRVTLDRDQLTIGRQSDNDIQVEGSDVSRHHAEVLRQEGGYLLRDLGSRFGTYVNGAAISERRMEHGDRIRLGNAAQPEIVFLESADAPPPPRPVLDTPTHSLGSGEFRQVVRLLEGLRAMGTVRVLEDVLALVIDGAIEATRAERGFVMLASDRGELEYKLGRSASRATLEGIAFDTSKKIPQSVFESGETMIVGDLMDPEVAGHHQGTIKIGIRGALCAPLKLVRITDRRDTRAEEPRCIGVLYLDSRNRGALLSEATRVALESLAMEAAVAIENARLYRESAEMARIEQELKRAAEIQQSLLPPRQWSRGPVEVAGATLPCRAIGGDFFDFFDLPNGSLGFSLADVAGKGPPAAMLAMRLQGMLSSLAEAGGSPAETLEHLNRSLLRRSIAPRFATVAYAVLTADGRLGACSAGHNPTILVSREGEVRQLSKGGLLLGLFDQPLLDEEWVQIKAGDTLVFFSDGVTEALNATGEQFGEERLLTCLRRAPTLSAEGTLECLLHHVNEFAGEVPQFDDVTVLVVRYNPA